MFSITPPDLLTSPDPGRGLTDEEVFGAPAAPAAPQTRGLSDEEVFGAGAGPAVVPGFDQSAYSARPSLGERFEANTKDAFSGGTLAGAGIEMGARGLGAIFDRNVNPQFGGMEGQIRAQQREERDAYNLMPGFETAPTLTDKVLEGGAALGGQILGSLPSPESFISAPAKLTAGLARGVEKLAGPTISKIFDQGARVGAVNVASDPVVQGMTIEGGVQDEYEPWRTALSGAIGFGFGATPATIGAVRESVARMRSRPNAETSPDAVTPDSVTPQEWQAVLQELGLSGRQVSQLDENYGRGLAERGNADEIAQAADNADSFAILANRQKNGVYVDSPTGGVETTERNRGTASQPAIRPASGQGGALVPVEPRREPMAPDDIAHSQAKMDAEGNVNTATPPDKIAVTEGGTAFPPNQMSPEEVLRVADVFDMAPSKVRDMLPGAQRALLRAADEQRASQAAADSAGPMRVTDTSGDGATSPPRAPQEPGPSTQARGAFEDTTRRPLGDDVAASGGSERPFRAESTDGATPDQLRGFEETARADAATARAASEEDLMRDWERYTRAEEEMKARANDPGNQRRQRERAQYEGKAKEKTFSNEVPKPDAAGRHAVDEFSNVTSSKGGPVRFADQKQAAKWILNKGHKTGDQIFEIANHPSGKGFTVRERGRTEPPPGGGAKEAPGARPAGEAPPPPPKDAPNAPQRALPPPARPQASDPKATPFNTKTRQAMSLTEWVRMRGGLKDAGGDVRSTIGGAKGRPGLVNNKAGMTLDDAALRAHEEGYFPDHGDNRPTINEFLQALDDDVRGVAPRHSEFDIDQQHIHDAALKDNADLDRAANELGIDTKGMSRDELVNEIEARKLDADDIERQAIQAEGDAIDASAGRGQDDSFDIPFEADHGRAGQSAPSGGVEGRNAGTPENAGPDGGRARPLDAHSKEAGLRGDHAGSAGKASSEGAQGVIPGTERSAQQAQDARDKTGTGRMKNGAAQKPADEGMFGDSHKQTDLVDAAKSGGGPKLYSGLPLDEMFAAAKKLGGWVVGDGWKKSMGDAARDIRRVGDERKLTKVPGASILRAALGDTTSTVRAIANKIENPEARKLANDIIDEWFVESGTTGGKGRTYDEAVSSREVSRINELGKTLGKYLDDDKALEQIVNLVRNPGMIRKGTPLGDAALGVQKLLREELEYMKQAGVEVGDVKSGYFPRAVDEMKVRRDPGSFVTAATAAYQRAGLNAKDARSAAESWRDNIMFGDNGSIMVPPGGTIDANFIKGRTLPKDADEILKNFLINDPKYALVHYVTRAARRAEFTRRIGPDNARWKEQIATLEKNGAGYVVPELRDYISTLAGVKPSGAKPLTQSVLSWSRTWATLGLLEKAMLTSIPEMIMPGIRAGNIVDAARSVGWSVMQFAKAKSTSTQQARELAEDIGLVVSSVNTMLSAARFSSGGATSDAQQKILQTYFRNTGLERFTNATRVAAVSIGQTFIRRTARGLEKSPNRMKAMLAELGVPKEKAADFAKWVLKQENGMPNSAALSGATDKAMADVYRTALIRFTDQSIMRPSAATRPGWASTPFGSTVFHLMNYTWAFQKNVINRPFRLMADKDLTVMEKARIAGPVLGMMPLLMVAQGLVSEGREAVFGDPTRTDPKTSQEKSMLWLSRAGLLGKFDPFINLATGVRYGRDLSTSALGPTFGRLSTAAQTGIEYATRNSERTNSAERKMAKTAYDVGVEPMVNLLLSAAPAGAPIAAVARQVAGSGWAREALVEPVAGAPEKRGAGGGNSGRGSGRGSSRGSGRGSGRGEAR